ncbi:TonB-dependent receptor, partial [Klebsiella pneumoniae]|nr:TonB-dependent receptor [Klebsiella pneumoniae]
LDQFSAHADVELGERLFWSSVAYMNKIDDRRFVRFSAGVSQQERYTNEEHLGAMSTLTWRPEVSWAKEFALVGGVSAEWQDNVSERYTT